MGGEHQQGAPCISMISMVLAMISNKFGRARRFSAATRLESSQWSAALSLPLSVRAVLDEIVDELLHGRDLIGAAGSLCLPGPGLFKGIRPSLPKQDGG